MANRDVNLTVRAKDQASQVVDAIANALDALKKSQVGVSKGAETAQSSLGRFATSLANLQSQISSQSVGGKLAKDLNLAKTAINNLTSSIEANRERQTQLALDADKTARKADNERLAVNRLTEEFNRQKLVLKELTTAKRLADKPVAKAVAAGTAVDPQAAAAAAKATEALLEQQSAVNLLKESLKAARAAARDAERDAFKLAEASLSAGRAAESQSADLRTAEAALQEYGQEADKAESKLKELAQTADRSLTQAIGRQVRVVQQARAAYQENTGVVAKAAIAQREAKAALDIATAGFKSNSSEVLNAKVAYDQAALSFVELKARGQGLKTEFVAQRDGLQQLRTVARETANDVNQLADRQARFSAVTANTNSVVTAARASNSGYSQTISQLRANLSSSAGAVNQNEAAQRKLANATAGTRVQTESLDSAFRRFYGGSRQALSLLQRLRGQFLGLAAGVTGFYAAVNQIGEVVNSIQKIEAAQSRLVAVNNGNAQKIANDLDFLRRTANRLGIDFGTLADQYTKFAASTQNTNIEKDTRGIFLAVAEAARVNKLSVEQLNGTLNALSQIAAKGTVQMEELKSQLGDRLPGAIQIMADGLGIGTTELFKLTEQGELSSEALSNFAQELNNRYGKALPSALKTSTTAMGAFGNAVFQARLRFADAGFDESFKNLLNSATEVIQSPDFQRALETLAKLAGGVISVIETALKNFSLVVSGVVGLLALRFAPVMIVAIRSIFNFGAALAGQATLSMGTFNRGVVVATASTRAFGTAATGAAVKTVLLSNAFKSLLISTGIGAAFVAISVAFAYFSTQADKAGEAVNRLQKRVDALRDAHQNGAASAEEYAEALRDVSVAELGDDLDTITKKLDQDFAKAARRAIDLLQGFDDGLGTSGRIQKDIADLAKGFRLGEITAEQFSTKIDELVLRLGDNTSFGAERARKAILGFADATRTAAEGLDAETQAIATAALKTGDFSRISKEAAESALGLVDATADITGGFVKGRREAQGMAAAIAEISEFVPKLKKEMDAAKDLASIKEILKAEGVPESVELITLRIKELKAEMASAAIGDGLTDFRGLGGNDGLQKEIDRLEAYKKTVIDAIDAINAKANKETASKDPFGDALKKLNESLRDDVRDLDTTKLEADNSKLAAIMSERANYVADLREEIDKIATPEQLARFDALGQKFIDFGNQVNQQDQAEAVRDVIKAFDDEILAAEEASAKLSQTDKTRADRLRQLRIEQEQFTAARLKELTDEGRAYEDLSAEEKARFDAALTAYKSATDAAFRFSEIMREEQDQIDAASKASDLFNSQLERRAALLSLLAQQQAAGDTSGVNETQSAIVSLNESLREAGANALAFWQALTQSEDPEVAENAKVQVAEIEAGVKALGDAVYQTTLTLGDLYEVIASSGSEAFIGFLESVAAGEGIFKSLGKALQQFVSDTLIQIGKLIIQALILQAVLAAMEAFFPGSSALILAGAKVANTTAGVNHSGKKGGTGSNTSRSVPSAAFFGAPRFHDGRLGIKSGETPAILEKTEDVLTDDNPFHSKNLSKTVAGMSGGGTNVQLKNVNVLDAAEILQAALSDTEGQRVLINYIGKNSGDVNSALGK